MGDEEPDDDVDGGGLLILHPVAPTPPMTIQDDFLVTSQTDQSEMFQHVEECSRLLTAAATPWEESMLRNMGGNPSDIEKVIRNFGEPSGAGRACRDLLQQKSQAMVLTVGSSASVQ